MKYMIMLVMLMGAQLYGMSEEAEKDVVWIGFSSNHLSKRVVLKLLAGKGVDKTVPELFGTPDYPLSYDISRKDYDALIEVVRREIADENVRFEKVRKNL